MAKNNSIHWREKSNDKKFATQLNAIPFNYHVISNFLSVCAFVNVVVSSKCDSLIGLAPFVCELSDIKIYLKFISLKRIAETANK